ncbi:MAG: hypothetical protein APF77_06675 [Clostridia bacterium BRH_c25]|nr:MAG: hypothetical protein APF77_06675 [Clostridia bacterium BRH_c25]
MAKALENMTNEELWELFPIIISEHKSNWNENYLTEKAIIEEAIGNDIIARMNHYGSTAVPNLPAKPTIDILLEVNDNAETEKLISDMRAIGYIYSPQPENPAPHMMFMKGYTPEGFKGQVYHVHVRYEGDWDELYFRDYLISHPDVADKYGKLKVELQKKFKNDRDGYTFAKTGFIKEITVLARKEMGDKYRL